MTNDVLRGIAAEHDRIELWLRTEVTAAYDALKADPGAARGIEQVRMKIAEQRSRLKS